MINRTIRTLLADRDMDPQTFMARAGLAKGTYYNRMKLRGGWMAAEVQRVADALGVPVGTLYEGLRLPHRDSNTEPADLRLVQVRAA